MATLSLPLPPWREPYVTGGPEGARLVREAAAQGYDPMRLDQRPGCYYVSAKNEADNYFLVAGPYDTHTTALELKQAVREHACRIDARGHWLAWGTCRTEEPRQALLGPWRPPQAQPGPSQAAARKTPVRRSRSRAEDAAGPWACGGRS